MTKKDTRKKIQIRIYIILTFISVCFLSLIVKLYILQIMEHENLLEKSEGQIKRIFYHRSDRGAIYDRNLRELAVNIKVDSVYANPKKIKNLTDTARTLSSILNIDRRELLSRLRKGKGFAWVKRKIIPEESVKVKEAGIKGIGFLRENKRFYPKRELAASVVGFVGMDNNGLAGLEYSYDDYLRRDRGEVILEKDALGRRVNFVANKSLFPLKEVDIVLTIDEVIQYIAEEELKKKVIETGADSGVIIVMAPDTGNVLAMADYPGFNPNSFGRYQPFLWQTRAVANTYEPGSTFKLILASAALEEKETSSDDLFFCENGEIDVGGITIHDHKSYKWLTFKEIVGKSSNVGAIKIAQELGKEKFYNYIRGFGFGSKTGIGIPGEAIGIVRDPGHWSKVSIGSIAIGQEISVTPIQLVTAVSCIANGGLLMEPRVVKSFMRDGVVVREFPPKVVRRVVSERTAREMTDILKYVVEYGTGRLAMLEGSDVAGKTGTAQKIDPVSKTYMKDKFLASFVGYFPVDDPKVAMLVMIDEPKEIFWGGQVAAPVFREVARRVRRYMNIPSDSNKIYRFADKSLGASPQLE